MTQGWKLIDVRSIPEFDQSHPAGAYNVPLVHRGPAGSTPNRDFLAVVETCFGKREGLVMTCRTGQRSLRAAEVLADAGFENVVDMRGGFTGETDAKGAVVCAGWTARNLPVEKHPEPGRSYLELKGDA
jgi:rhodanese-related sulfurtransferase